MSSYIILFLVAFIGAFLGSLVAKCSSKLIHKKESVVVKKPRTKKVQIVRVPNTDEIFHP